MKITRGTWQKYITVLRKLNSKATDDMSQRQRALQRAVAAGEISSEDAAKALTDYAYAIATKYGEGAAAASCEMYDAVAVLQGAKVPAAVPAQTATYGEAAKTVYGVMKQSLDQIPAAVGRLVKQAGVDTTMHNAIRDGAEWAWIPSGDSCAFCQVLASQGWVKASKKVMDGDHASHIHNHCDCTFAIRFDGRSTVEGYDPDALRAQYDAAEGNTPQEKVNAMRRANYAANKDAINAQKRAAYARRVELKKVLDGGDGGGYNNSPVDDDELRRRYNRDVATGWISALCGLDNYKTLYYRIENEIVGIETQTGLTVKSQSEHFLARVIGSSVDQNRAPKGVYKITGKDPKGHRSIARTGVGIDDIKETVLNGRPYPIKTWPDGSRSQRFKGRKCIVTINPDTGKLIQCNPRSR